MRITAFLIWPVVLQRGSAWLLSTANQATAATGTQLYDCPLCPESKLLSKRLAAFDFKPFDDYLQEYGRSARFPSNLISEYLEVLMPWVDGSPTTSAAHLKPPDVNIDCKQNKYASVLTGKTRATPARILDFVPFGFELDLLEIRLHELAELVDVHVIAESTRTHRNSSKPLFLKRNAARFSRFANKIVDFVLNDTEAARIKPRSIWDLFARIDKIHHVTSKPPPKWRNKWQLEMQIRKWMWRRYVQDFGQPDPNDLLIHGDLDEIPSRELVAHLKHCEMSDDVDELNVQGDFYRMNFDWIINATPKLWYPKVFKARRIAKANGFWREGNGTRPIDGVPWVPGGAHLNRFGSPAMLLYKHLALAEGGGPPRGSTEFMKDPNKLWPLIAQGQRECCDEQPGVVRPRQGEFIPWFADANWQRFPHLFPSRSNASTYS